MKKRIFFIFLITCTYLSAQKNLIKNGGFENNLSNWTNLSENGAKAKFSAAPHDKQIGSNCFKINVLSLGSNLWDAQSFQSFESKKNKTYTITFSAKSTMPGKEVTFQIQNKTFTPKTFFLDSDWNNYSWQFTAKENDLQLAMQFTQKGTFYIDNIVILETKKGKGILALTKKSKGKKIIENGNFEQGYNGWMNMTDGGGKVEYKLNTTKPFEGRNSMQVMVMRFGNNTWDIQSVSKINVKKGRQYKVTFYSRAGGRNKRVKAQIQDNPKKIYHAFEFKTEDAWQKHEFEFTAESDTMELTFQHISTGIVEYDNISIEPMGKKH